MTRVTIVNSFEAAKAIADKPPHGYEAMMWNAGYVVLDQRRDPPTINDSGDLVYTVKPKPPLARVEDWRVVFVPTSAAVQEKHRA